MEDTITIYSSQDLTTLVRSFEVEALAEPSDELTGKYTYIVNRREFLDAYKKWDRDEHPLLRVRDQLSHVEIFLGRPSAERIHEAIKKRQPNVHLL